jgi:RHS repeat-associated protein
VEKWSYPDWLGSERAVGRNEPAGFNFVASEAYAPFGETYAKSPQATTALFTNQPNDEAPDLYDFLAREEHRAQGRWLSPDPAGLAAADPNNPQSWNRYAYVSNQPTVTIDPDGTGGPGACSMWGAGCSAWNGMAGASMRGYDPFQLLEISLRRPIKVNTGGDRFYIVYPSQSASLLIDWAFPPGQATTQTGAQSSTNATQPKKSRARQDCQDKAEADYAQEKQDALNDAGNAGVATFAATEFAFGAFGCVLGSIGGAALGTTISEFTGGLSSFGGAIVGCVTGGVDMAANAVGPAVFTGAIGGAVGYGTPV